MKHRKVDLKLSIALCFLPQILVFFPTLFKILIKVWMRHLSKEAKFKLFLKDASGYWAISLASTIFVGSDYFFVSHFLSPDQVAQYHFASFHFLFLLPLIMFMRSIVHDT